MVKNIFFGVLCVKDILKYTIGHFKTYKLFVEINIVA